LKTRVSELHPYDVPEFLVLPVSEGAKPYLDWIFDSVR
jgi:periplasmic divalent cation tolerance protein